MNADLHLHTTASDGRLKPGELIELVAEKGLDVISITDHDTVNGIRDGLTAAVRFPAISLIPGVEISTDVPQGEVHVLGYFIDFTDAEFLSRLEEMRNSRQLRARRMVEKLAELGLPVRWERVHELAGGGAVGRPHIAEAMLEAGYITSFKEAFEKYIGKNGPAYASRFKISPVDAVRMVVQAKGLPVLAHPTFVNDLEGLLPDLIKAGMIGMEVYYKDYAPNTVDDLAAIADRNGLVKTGGTDYHAFGDEEEVVPGGVTVPEESVRRLYEMADKGCLDLIEKYSQ